MPTTATMQGRRLTLTLACRNPGGGPVSADLAAYVTVIETPSGFDPLAPDALVHVDGRDYEVPPLHEVEAPSIVIEQAPRAIRLDGDARASRQVSGKPTPPPS